MEVVLPEVRGGPRKGCRKKMKKIFLVASLTFLLIAPSVSAKVRNDRDDKKMDKKVVKVEKKGAFLGIYMENIDKDSIKDLDYPKSSGVIVSGIIDDSPAEEAGLEEGDIIYSVDGKQVSSGGELADLIGDMKPGDEIEVVLYRDGDRKKIDVELGERKQAYVTIDMDDEDWAGGRNFHLRPLGGQGRVWFDDDGEIMIDSFMKGSRLGLELFSMDKDLAGYFDVKPDEGMLVLDVIDDSPAEKAGIKPGDVLKSIEGSKISEIDDVMDALADVDDGQSIEVVVVRKGDTKKLDLEVEKGWKGDISGMPGMHRHEMRYAVPVPPDAPNVEEFKMMRMKGLEKAELEKKIEELEKAMQKLQEKIKKM